VNNTGMFLFILPLLILYVFLQRYFIESIERTGIVG
jgi:multiple sugar transport system permease protein